MKILKNFKKFKLNENSDSGELKLFIDAKLHSSWFYFRDAIENGLLEEYFGLSYDVDEFPWKDYFSEDFFDMSEITDMIENCFESEDFDDFDTFLKMLEDEGFENVPDMITFFGMSEDGEEYDVTYQR